MWMLSASSARRWSRRGAVLRCGSGTVTVAIKTPSAFLAIYRNAVDGVPKKKPGTLVPGVRSFACCWAGCSYPNGETDRAGTSRVRIQQQAHGQQLQDNTVR